MRVTLLLLGLFAGAGLEAQEPSRVESVTISGTKVSFDLVALPAATYDIGVAGQNALRPVPLKAFAIGRREVSWREFDFYYAVHEVDRVGVDGMTRPSKGKPYFSQVHVPDDFLNSGRPATCLRWHSAVGYCDWLTRKTGHFYRLPTEPEWEAACRAGSKGKTVGNLKEHAWYGATGEKSTHDPGLKKANPWGLYDMLGNVWEYCLEQDEHPLFSPIVRGGSFRSPESEVAFSSRKAIPPEWFEADPQSPRSVWWLTNGWHQGFRVVRVPNSTAERVKKVYADKIRITIGKPQAPRYEKRWKALLTRVVGEIENVGNRMLDELELQVYPLSPQGKPVFVGANSKDVEAMAIFSKCYPVLVNSGRNGPHQAPLAPGGKRKWALDLPTSLDGEDVVEPDKFGARVTAVRFSKGD